MNKAFLETKRLRLCSWSLDDFTRFKPIGKDPEVMRYISGGIPWTDERIREFIDRQMKTCGGCASIACGRSKERPIPG